MKLLLLFYHVVGIDEEALNYSGETYFWGVFDMELIHSIDRWRVAKLIPAKIVIKGAMSPPVNKLLAIGILLSCNADLRVVKYMEIPLSIDNTCRW